MQEDEDDEEPITFAELDRLCDLDPVDLSTQNLDQLIKGMRLYRANALGKAKGKATKFTEASGIDASFIREKLKAAGVVKVPTEKIRRLK